MGKIEVYEDFVRTNTPLDLISETLLLMCKPTHFLFNSKTPFNRVLKGHKGRANKNTLEE